MDFQETLNAICKELPDGYQVIIECEKGYGGVKLLIPDSDAEIENDDPELTLEAVCLGFIELAKSGKYG